MSTINKKPLTLMVVPCCANAETTYVSLALTKAIQKQRFKAKFLQPINQRYMRSSKIVKEFKTDKPIDVRYVEHLLSHGEEDELLENILELHNQAIKDVDVIIVKGLTCHPDQPYVARLNAAIANALDARVLILAVGDKKKHGLLEDQIQIATRGYNIAAYKKVIGFIINRMNMPADFIPSEAENIANIPSRKRPKFRKQAIINFMAQYFQPDWIQMLMTRNFHRNFSTTMFRYQLIQKAHAAHKKIILPEATDPRILQAAMICTRRKIAHCILLGHPNEIQQTAHAHGIELNNEIEIINPKDISEKYVNDLVKIRKHKGMTKELAEESLQDLTTLATMMLNNNEVDGIVSGAIHTTANTIRPALQIIKTKPSAKLVSSLFFMCLKEQVMVYADCAIVPNPTAEELAEIAIETNDSTALFGIEPKVAMISYSTGSSGQGPDVEKVRLATNIVRQTRPDILIDGPIQYDAAVDEETARKKMPESQIAGQATVCIFPDLNTGNALYKAVQRSANITSIGPMLQGLNKPVNDLSRGCLVEDIVFTIAITAIQATYKK